MSSLNKTKTTTIPDTSSQSDAPETSRHSVNDDVLLSNVDPAGKHFIIDFWGADHLEDVHTVEKALRTAAQAAGAVLLHSHLHKFGEGGGVTGVALLAESHISIHTWPELQYAALDVFMCGASKPELAVDCLAQAFQPEKIETREILRGAKTN
jgi:S-adenosylmethionine decarboxylase